MIPEHQLFGFPTAEQYEEFKAKYRTFNYQYSTRRYYRLTKFRQKWKTKRFVMTYRFSYNNDFNFCCREEIRKAWDKVQYINTVTDKRTENLHHRISINA